MNQKKRVEEERRAALEKQNPARKRYCYWNQNGQTELPGGGYTYPRVNGEWGEAGPLNWQAINPNAEKTERSITNMNGTSR